MSKLVRLGALLVAMTAITASAISIADAQDKGKDPKKPAEKPGKVEVYMAKDGYRFRIMDADGKTIAMTTKAYDKKEDAHKALEQVKATLNTVKVTEVKEEKKDDKKEEKKP